MRRLASAFTSPASAPWPTARPRPSSSRAAGRGAPDSRLRRALGVAGDRAARRPRRRFARSDPRVRGRATVGATRSSARSRSSPDVEASRPAGEHDIARIVELAVVMRAELSVMKGGSALVAARSVARAARRLVPRPARARRRARRRRHHRRRRARLRRGIGRTAAIGRLARRHHRPLRRGGAREVGIGEAIMDDLSPSAPSVAASASTGSRCRATARRRTSSRSTTSPRACSPCTTGSRLIA